MFDDIYIMHLRKMSEGVLDKLNRKEPLTTEEQLTLILYGLNNHYHTMEEGILTEMKGLRSDIDLRFEQVDKRFEQVDKRFEQVDKRFDRIYTFLYWMIGTLLAGMGLGFSSLAILN